MQRVLAILGLCYFVIFATNGQVVTEMGSCRMVCDSSPGLHIGSASVGRPGKRGATGPKGDKGMRGQRGEPADPCLCPEHDSLQNQINEMKEQLRRVHSPRDCKEVVPRRETHTGGVFTIYPSDTEPTAVEVYCDTNTDGGGWTVFQRRVDGSEDFERGWNDYVHGFGDLNKEFWLGLEKMHWITSKGKYELRVDMEDFENNTAYAKYSSFKLGDSTTHYALTSSGYSGTAGNALTLTNIGFTTKDADHDTNPSGNCATSYKGGMWYTKCHSANPNGLYLKGKHDSYANGVNWQSFKGYHYSLKFIEMKFRRIDG